MDYRRFQEYLNLLKILIIIMTKLNEKKTVKGEYFVVRNYSWTMAILQRIKSYYSAFVLNRTQYVTNMIKCRKTLKQITNLKRRGGRNFHLWFSGFIFRFRQWQQRWGLNFGRWMSYCWWYLVGRCTWVPL
jgi:hypothetical protein